MAKNVDLTKADILHIAKLANLSLSENEVEKYLGQLLETIKYVENLDELDTKNVQPTSHSTNVTNVYFEDGEKCTRMFSKEEALNLAGMKADALIESFDFERNKRGLIQYQTLEIEKKSKAKTSLQRAKELTREMEKLLAD